MAARFLRNSRPLRRPAHRVRPILERLEDRSLLAAALTASGQQLLLVTQAGEIQTVQLEAGADVADALAAYQSKAGILSAELDQQVSVEYTPNDTYFASNQWALRNVGQTGGTVDADIDADLAWDIHKGTSLITVGVIDTGVDYRHPDLYLNIWINPGEVPAGVVDTDGDNIITFYDLNDSENANAVLDDNEDGRIDGSDLLNDRNWANDIDDDHNGKIDDLIGWDFVNEDNNPLDDNNHGTHVAGTIGAIGDNNLGVVGVNHRVRIAPLKFLNASGSGSTSGAIAALEYALAKGIQISNNSWGGGGYSSALATAINNARLAGHIYVAAAGNSGSNNDLYPNYPSNYNYNNIIAVASSTSTDQRSSFSNYGATTVDLAAPGSSILSTTRNNTYSTFSGTSMATPHVAGAAALVWSKTQSLTYQQVISRLLNNVDYVPALSGLVATSGRLNVYRALNADSPPTDNTGPQVVSAVPNGPNNISYVEITFNEAINPNSFGTNDITNFFGPGGVPITATSITAVDTSNTRFRVNFATQSTPGSYQFTLGPAITDVAGNAMAAAYTATFSISTQTTYTYTNSSPQPIYDYQTVYAPIVIPSSMIISDLKVRINITHTYDSDVLVYLIGPDGMARDLVRYRGGSGDNFNNTLFDDDAATSVVYGVAPFSGSYRPENALSYYDNKNAQGTWRLYVYDRAFFDTGTLHSWSLIITTLSGAAVDVPAEGQTPAPLPGADLVRDVRPIPAALPAALPPMLSRVEAALTTPLPPTPQSPAAPLSGLAAFLVSERLATTSVPARVETAADETETTALAWLDDEALRRRELDRHDQQTPTSSGEEEPESESLEEVDRTEPAVG